MLHMLSTNKFRTPYLVACFCLWYPPRMYENVKNRVSGCSRSRAIYRFYSPTLVRWTTR